MNWMRGMPSVDKFARIVVQKGAIEHLLVLFKSFVFPMMSETLIKPLHLTVLDLRCSG